ncbi:MAG: FtsX-like permease family protein [Syntrophobacteraceae bacterium]
MKHCQRAFHRAHHQLPSHGAPCHGAGRPQTGTALCLPLCLALTLMLALLPAVAGEALARTMFEHVEFFAGLKDRSTGSEGSEKAADYILKAFQDAGLKEVGVQKFLTPIPEVQLASLELEGKVWPIHPWGPNLVYLPKTPKEGLQGPLLYVGAGSLDQLDGKTIEGAIVLMDMGTTGNWWTLAMLGARAVIYVGSPADVRGELEEKNTKTPLAFPRFWVTPDTGRDLVARAVGVSAPCTIKSDTRWSNRMVRNCYGFLPGRKDSLKGELVVVDAFYDASSHVLSIAPGADEATSIAALLVSLEELAKNPPDRPVLFLATVGNGQGLAGMREFVWALTTRKKILRKQSKTLQDQKQLNERQLELLEHEDPFSITGEKDRQMVWELLVEKAKDRADALTRESQYRKALGQEGALEGREEARPYRRLSWRMTMDGLTDAEKSLALGLLQEARTQFKARRREIKSRYEAIKSASTLRSQLDEYTPVLYLTLYLSTHSPYAGLMEMGEAYPVRESIKRIPRATRFGEILGKTSLDVAAALGMPSIFRQVGKAMSSEDYIGRSSVSSHPCCDVGALAGLPTVALTSLDNSRKYWSTPNDTLENVDRANLTRLERFLPPVLGKAFSHPALASATEGGIKGLASLEGRAMFIRQGELFPDQPAPGTIISVLQGESVFRTMVLQDGTFFIPGLANNRVALEKLILEPYGLDPETGRIAWTADKVQTGKINYRIKLKSDLASTSLVMFRCQQTDVIRAFNPRNMSYLTKVDLLDAATEATPLRYWYSRVDGRDTLGISVFLEKGTRFKLIMSESLLSKDLFLINANPEAHTGKGFLIGSPPTILTAPYQVAGDLFLLLKDRLGNLTQHGITNQHLQGLYETSGRELEEAGKALREGRYSRFWEYVVSAWSRLDVVYADIERTQRDVLTGVMFFIALFVPFAYCMERYLFAFRGIYQQLTAFLLILITTILVIRALHPAFQLTYSPMVVIIAFFIVGLSLMVSWIIFARFEKEMADLHSRTAHLRSPQASKWQSFGAGFAIGVSNLNRRKLRTGLTCMTLVILTFTVMSFTSVKSINRTTQTRLSTSAEYNGILLKHLFWLPITQLTLEDLRARFAAEAEVFPRGWIEPRSGSTDRMVARIYRGDAFTGAEGILGLGAAPPESLRKILSSGRWFEPGEGNVALLPVTMTQTLGLDPETTIGETIRLLGQDFKVIGTFDPVKLQRSPDLDQNPMTPAYLEMSRNEELSEVEVEAMQSGEEVLPTTGRFRYAGAEATIVIPYATSIALGGKLKAISILPHAGVSPLSIADRLTSWLSYPLFVGENGTWYFSAGSTVRYQGAANVLVPILIVVFITLNTMIGHVHERQREIGTYTSVGLAPTHVGFLFIVEAMSLAVISTVIGYILAQLSARFLGQSGLFSQLTFNYSSLASVACMFLVFSVVFLAALYPARMAAEIAMPDVNRSWTLPEAEGDRITLNLPFLLKYEEEKGVMSFLNAFYASYRDTSHGSFIVDEVLFDMDDPFMRSELMPAPVCLLIRTNVWLAPFDFGIKQRIQLHCCPSIENPGYLEIAIQMIRLSGERSAWARANKNFIKALRKQMLLWRLLDQEAKRGYDTPSEAV